MGKSGLTAKSKLQGALDALGDTESTSLGERKNSGKPRWSLLPFDALGAVVDVMEFGATKYEKRNWEKGLKYSDTFDSMLRHLTRWYQMGEEHDVESGLHHLAHVAWNALALLAFAKRGRSDLDDRPAQSHDYFIHDPTKRP